MDGFAFVVVRLQSLFFSAFESLFVGFWSLRGNFQTITAAEWARNDICRQFLPPGPARPPTQRSAAELKGEEKAEQSLGLIHQLDGTTIAIVAKANKERDEEKINP